MSQTKFQTARELIQEHHYAAARELLETMPDEPRAKEWLKKLPKRKRHIWRNVAIYALIFIAGVAVGVTPPKPQAGVISTAAVMAVPTTEIPAAAAAYLTQVQRVRELDLTSSVQPAASATITDTATPNLAATQAQISGQQTRAALNVTAQAMNAELTAAAPTAVPPLKPLTFSGGANPQVLGPITLPAGIYRARVVTSGFFIATLQITDGGECGTGTSFLIPSIFNLSRGEGQPSAEALVRSSGCTAYIEIQNVTDSWQLTISPA